MDHQMSFKTVAIMLAVAIPALYLGWKLTSRSAYESAEYDVVLTDGPFEIRDYPNLMLASTAMGSVGDQNDGSFMRLFRYISGANEAKQNVAMTVPVFMEAASEGDQASMGFVVPAAVASSEIPAPSSADVQIRCRDGGRFAVIRFSGQLTNASRTNAEQKLRDWMQGRQLAAGTGIEFAGYDPPWTPGMFRRNEVLIRILDTPQAVAD
jgi:DNA gyrase inhibitor GyrI